MVLLLQKLRCFSFGEGFGLSFMTGVCGRGARFFFFFFFGILLLCVQYLLSSPRTASSFSTWRRIGVKETDPLDVLHQSVH